MGVIILKHTVQNLVIKNRVAHHQKIERELKSDLEKVVIRAVHPTKKAIPVQNHPVPVDLHLFVHRPLPGRNRPVHQAKKVIPVQGNQVPIDLQLSTHLLLPDQDLPVHQVKVPAPHPVQKENHDKEFQNENDNSNNCKHPNSTTCIYTNSTGSGRSY